MTYAIFPAPPTACETNEDLHAPRTGKGLNDGRGFFLRLMPVDYLLRHRPCRSVPNVGRRKQVPAKQSRYETLRQQAKRRVPLHTLARARFQLAAPEGATGEADKNRVSASAPPSAERSPSSVPSDGPGEGGKPAPAAVAIGAGSVDTPKAPSKRS